MIPTSLAAPNAFDPATMTERMNQRFETADVDGDGALSQTEFSDALASAGMEGLNAEQAFARLDSNGDGAISQQEQLDRVQAITDRLQSYGPGNAGGSALDTVSTLLDQLAASSDDDSTSDQAQTLLQQLQSGDDRARQDAGSFLATRLPSINVRA